MRFIFSRRFYVLFTLAVIPLSLAWTFPVLKYGVLGYDILLVAAAVTDIILSRKFPSEFTITRQLEKRFAIGFIITCHSFYSSDLFFTFKYLQCFIIK